ncbi:hypothetical protein BDY21DRAFT_3608 [Lineolata rhizophorae]|uniref:FYVE-type domain-containing protein n=1 Tax=Lineolata rhizophorae TaxID=578093 RepID=A0A6A6PDS8_9PEZI|nr:hypothetical protein BDY21DRAFT_3608 [Lineolata rhizophorae]
MTAPSPTVVSPPPQPFTNSTQYTFPGAYHASSVNTSPANSTTVSPTSPRSTHHHTSSTNSANGVVSRVQTRQLRAPKTPLYVPAVLRPTEKPIRHSPPKNGGEVGASEAGTPVDDGRFAGAARRGTADSNESGLTRTSSDSWGEESFGPVTGPPTKAHWKPDNSTDVCTSPTCNKAFHFFERRHHCRRCGGVFCGQHSSAAVKLDHSARFHPGARYHRACDNCWAEYRDWEAARISRSNSASSGSCDMTPRSAGGVPDGAGNKATPLANSSNSTMGGMKIKHVQKGFGDGAQKVGSVAGSVPRDWSWSTF